MKGHGRSEAVLFSAFHLLLITLLSRWSNAFLHHPSRHYHRRSTLSTARRGRSVHMGKPLIVGLNKYSHDTSISVISAATGEFLFMAEKERITRKKHDAGDVADLVEHALESIHHDLSDIKLVIQQNHHWRIAPFERRLAWASALEQYPLSYLEETSLFPHLAPTHIHELSHHLAHAWSVFPQAPFSKGLVVVMDGMGEQYKVMAQALRDGDKGYTTDLSLEKHESFVQVPSVLDPCYTYREAESAYLFDGFKLRLVFKRYTRERSPPELFNHGFESMESMGAVYSRISSHVFGDWNACGKVMGLASYGGRQQQEESPFMEGELAIEGAFKIDWETIEGLKYPNEWQEADEEKTKYYSEIAYRVQVDLEKAALDWIRWLKERTGATNLCLAGGVVQNSVLNGRICRELGFGQVFIPPYPGDEGISCGCAYWGLHAETSPVQSVKGETDTKRVMRHIPLSAYQGKEYSAEEIECRVLKPLAPFIRLETLENMDDVVEKAASLLAQGKAICWFQGRSECGPRALGMRSLVADPRQASMIDHLNQVKGRERFRPFAPSVLAGDAEDWFEGLTSACDSPFMSLTVPVRPLKRDQVPAICHVDGTARLQVVHECANPWYYKLIQAFKRLTGIPLCLNTSFNIRGEPIVESPEGAVRSFLSAAWGIDGLVLGKNIVYQRAFPPSEEGFDPALAIVRKVDGILLEEVLSDSETGAARRVRIARGTKDRVPDWMDLDGQLDLLVLASIDNLTPLADVIENVLDLDEEVTEEDVIEALRRLYAQLLVYF